MQQFRFGIGDSLKDQISRFTGIVVGIAEHHNGCVRYYLDSEKLNGGKIVQQVFDDQQLSLVKKCKTPPLINGKPSKTQDFTFKFGLGDLVIEQITRMSGAVYTRVRWYNGCNRYALLSDRLNDGKPVEANFNENSLTLETKGKFAPVISASPPGGRFDAAPRTGL